MADKPRGRGRARGRIHGDADPPPGPPAPTSGPAANQARPRQADVPVPQKPMLGWGRATARRGDPVAEPSGQESAVVAFGSAAKGDKGNGGNGMRRGTVRGRREVQGVIRTRPQSLATKLGTSGTMVRLSANYFKLLQTTNWCLFQYRVDIAPDEDRTNVKKALFNKAVKGILAGYIFDGTVLYTSNRLSSDPLEVFVQDERTNQNFRFTIRFVGDVALGDHQYLQFFNMIIRKCLGHLKLQLVGRDFFDALAKVRISNFPMELWPGYKTSIRQHENAILMCVEITHKVMRYDTVLHLLGECAREDKANYKRLFQSRIMGAVVLTEYNNRTYRIDDVDFNSTPTSTFLKKDGTSVSFAQYYKDRYNLRIGDLNQPLLVSRAKSREIRAGMPEQVILVPELCRMTGLTDAQRANFQLMRELANHTRLGPESRIQKLLQFSQRLSREPAIVEELKQWDWQLAETLVQFAGRVLTPVTIHVGDTRKFSAGQDADWTKELRNKPMLYTVPVKQWVVVCPTRFKSSAQSFVQMLIRSAEGMRWSLPMPKLQEIADDRPYTCIEGIQGALNKFNPQLTVCIVSSINKERYSAIKKKCYVQCAIPNQIIVAKNLDAKGAMSIATKIAIQMNCKLGGAPWCVPLPLQDTMVIGYDVCHDTNHKERSYGAFVATLNRECTHYFSSVTPHTSGEELSNDFALTTVKCLKAWQEIHKALPKSILIYRDGVGDGQLAYVYEHEVQNVKKKLAELYGSNNVKMCFIVVSKRINTRIFTERGQNPAPGTVVDDVITLPERYDFFIVSQCVRQGTVSPTSYNVLFDTMGQSPDRIQQLTYILTHMYFNWSGTVRVPAPCQYAHKLAALVGQHLHCNPNSTLDRSLYFL